MQQSQSRGKVLDGLIRLRDSGDVKGIQVIPGNKNYVFLCQEHELILYVRIDLAT
jgi:hypothetical protein